MGWYSTEQSEKITTAYLRSAKLPTFKQRFLHMQAAGYNGSMSAARSFLAARGVNLQTGRKMTSTLALEPADKATLQSFMQKYGMNNINMQYQYTKRGTTAMGRLLLKS